MKSLRRHKMIADKFEDDIESACGELEWATSRMKKGYEELIKWVELTKPVIYAVLDYEARALRSCETGCKCSFCELRTLAMQLEDLEAIQPPDPQLPR